MRRFRGGWGSARGLWERTLSLSSPNDGMKVLMVHPQFSLMGGAELAAMPILEHMVTHYHAEVTLLTLEPVDQKGLLAMAGLGANERRVINSVAECPAWLRSSRRFDLLRLAFLHREAKKRSPDFQLCISTYNDVDFGRAGFQYLH